MRGLVREKPTHIERRLAAEKPICPSRAGLAVVRKDLPRAFRGDFGEGCAGNARL
jgi:hypothetical protein